MKRLEKLMLALLLVCLMAVLARIVLLEYDPHAAYSEAQEFIKDRLKAPASAEFPSFVLDRDAIRTDEAGDGRYHVTAWVDAQNPFGAKLRDKWVCDLRKVESGKWEHAGPCALIDDVGIGR